MFDSFGLFANRSSLVAACPNYSPQSPSCDASTSSTSCGRADRARIRSMSLFDAGAWLPGQRGREPDMGCSTSISSLKYKVVVSRIDIKSFLHGLWREKRQNIFDSCMLSIMTYYADNKNHVTEVVS